MIEPLVLTVALITILTNLSNYGIDPNKSPHLKDIRVRRDNQPYANTITDESLLTTRIANSLNRNKRAVSSYNASTINGFSFIDYSYRVGINGTNGFAINPLSSSYNGSIFNINNGYRSQLNNFERNATRNSNIYTKGRNINNDYTGHKFNNITNIRYNGSAINGSRNYLRNSRFDYQNAIYDNLPQNANLTSSRFDYQNANYDNIPHNNLTNSRYNHTFNNIPIYTQMSYRNNKYKGNNYNGNFSNTAMYNTGNLSTNMLNSNYMLNGTLKYKNYFNSKFNGYNSSYINPLSWNSSLTGTIVNPLSGNSSSTMKIFNPLSPNSRTPTYIKNPSALNSSLTIRTKGNSSLTTNIFNPSSMNSSFTTPTYNQLTANSSFTTPINSQSTANSSFTTPINSQSTANSSLTTKKPPIAISMIISSLICPPHTTRRLFYGCVPDVEYSDESGETDY